MFNKTTWLFTDTRHSGFFPHGFLIPTSCLLFWVLCDSKVGTVSLPGCMVPRSLTLSTQPHTTEGIAQRDRLRGQRQPFLSTQPHVLCQEVIQLAASTPSFRSKPTLRQRLWSSGALVHRAELSIYGFFYPSHQTQELLSCLFDRINNESKHL